MNRITFILFLSLVGLSLSGQKYFTREGSISFSSDAPMEKIEATNSRATAVLDLESGGLEWAVLIKAFEFKKALMQEHFNENYMESSKYPKATFKGKIKSSIDFSTDGKYDTEVDGVLTIHGVSKDISTHASFTVSEGAVSATSSLKVLVADYNIEIPGVVKDNIAKEVEIIISAQLQPLKKK